MAFPDPATVAAEIENGALEQAAGGGTASGEGAPETSQSQEQSQALAEVIELDKLQKFKFENQEYTPKDLKAAILRQQDYTRKTQEAAEARKYDKYYDNLYADLGKVRANPALKAEFLRTYPERFHSYLEYLSQAPTNTPAQPENGKQGGSQSQYAQLDPALVQRFESLERVVTEKEVQSIAMNLETQEKTMLAKYPEADVEAVYAKAQAFLDKEKEKPKDERQPLTPELWERLYKADHDKREQRYVARYKDNINKQKQAGFKGRDAGPGGGTPGGSPKSYKSIKEATQAWREDEGIA